MIVAQEISEDLQRPLVEGLRTAQVALRSQHIAEIVGVKRNLRVV